MKGTAIKLTVKHSTGKKTELRAKVDAIQYGPVAVFDAGGHTHIAHAASGAVLLSLRNGAAAALACESLLRLVEDWGHAYDRGHVVFSPSLTLAVARLRG